MRNHKKPRIANSILSAIACMQIFTGSPGQESVSEPVRLSRGNSMNMPSGLAQAVAPLIAQGFYIMSWEVSPARTGFMVELYHSDPGRLASDRDDFRTAASRGMGISLRRFISAQY